MMIRLEVTKQKCRIGPTECQILAHYAQRKHRGFYFPDKGENFRTGTTEEFRSRFLVGAYEVKTDYSRGL